MAILGIGSVTFDACRMAIVGQFICERFVAIFLGGLLFLAVFAGATWAYNAKVWLMDDYRSGYDLGSGQDFKQDDPDRNTWCFRVMNEVYGQEISEGEDAGNGFPEAASAFNSGCEAGVTGEDNGFWHVVGRLDE